MVSAATGYGENTYKATAELFESIKGYRDSDKLKEECLRRAESVRKDRIYNQAQDKMNSAITQEKYESAASLFASIKGYRDSETLEIECLEQAEIVRKDSILRSAKLEMDI